MRVARYYTSTTLIGTGAGTLHVPTLALLAIDRRMDGASIISVSWIVRTGMIALVIGAIHIHIAIAIHIHGCIIVGPQINPIFARCIDVGYTFQNRIILEQMESIDKGTMWKGTVRV